MKLRDIQESRYHEPSDIVQWIRNQIPQLKPSDHGDTDVASLSIPGRADEAIEILTRLFKQKPKTAKGLYPHWSVTHDGQRVRVVVRPATKSAHDSTPDEIVIQVFQWSGRII